MPAECTCVYRCAVCEGDLIITLRLPVATYHTHRPMCQNWRKDPREEKKFHPTNHTYLVSCVGDDGVSLLKARVV